MITVVIGKLFSIEWMFSEESRLLLSLGDMDGTIAIALQTLRSIG